MPSSVSTQFVVTPALRALNQLRMSGSLITGHANFSGDRKVDRRRIASKCLLQSFMNFSRSMISLLMNDHRSYGVSVGRVNWREAMRVMVLVKATKDSEAGT